MRILVTGPFGQDGSYLIENLTREGHEVWGLVHRHGDTRQEWLTTRSQATRERLMYVEGDLTDQASLVAAVASIRPQVIYHLGAISAPAAGWMYPVHMLDVTGLGTVRLLEAVRLVMAGEYCQVIVAGSIATHGPYGAAKGFSRSMAADYRLRGLPVSVAVLGGHHSPRRARHFLGRKVTYGAARVAHELSLGLKPAQLRLGPLNRSQDWMDARDAVRALQTIADGVHSGTLRPGDFVVSTGDPHSSREWVEAAFAVAGLKAADWVSHDDRFDQPTDVPTLTAQPSPELPWEPHQTFKGLVSWMVGADLALLDEQLP